MKSKFLYLSILILISSFALFDLGAPSINAVCRIELKNGDIVEGMLQIVNGGYYGFHKNGFGQCYSDQDILSYNMFNLDKYVFTDTNSMTRIDPKTGSRNYPEKYFLSSSQTGRFIESSFDREKKISNVNIKYSRTTLKSFHLYTSLPASLWLLSEVELSSKESELEFILINVDEIKEFELLANPSLAWRNLIKNTRIEGASVTADWEDFQEPLWYHEILINEEQKILISNKLGKQNRVENSQME